MTDRGASCGFAAIGCLNKRREYSSERNGLLDRRGIWEYPSIPRLLALPSVAPMVSGVMTANFVVSGWQVYIMDSPGGCVSTLKASVCSSGPWRSTYCVLRGARPVCSSSSCPCVRARDVVWDRHRTPSLVVAPPLSSCYTVRLLCITIFGVVHVVGLELGRFNGSEQTCPMSYMSVAEIHPIRRISFISELHLISLKAVFRCGEYIGTYSTAIPYL